MEVILSSDRVDVQECDLVATGFFQNERPLRSTAGWIDWRLNGRLSRFIKEGRMEGDWEETVLIPSEGRLAAPLILLVGLGRVSEYDRSRLRQLVPHLITTLQGIGRSHVCLAFPSERPYSVGAAEVVGVLTEGFADWVERASFQGGEEWSKRLRLIFSREAGTPDQIMLGIARGKSILGEALQIRSTDD